MVSLLCVWTIAVLTAFAVLSAAGSPTRSSKLAARQDAQDGALTNAVRLARGLTPRSPRRLFSPTGVRRAVPSNAPVSQSGIIQITTRDTGSLVGYLNSFDDGQITDSPSTRVMFTQSANAATAMEITDLTGAVRFGAGNYNGYSNIIGSGSGSFIQFAAVSGSVPANSPPSDAPSNGRPVETTIWTIDPVTPKFSLTCTNPDMSQVVGSIVAVDGTELLLTGDPALLQQGNPDSEIVPVNLYFIPTLS